MILAAGLGTRLKPFTDHHPKALAVVNHKTLLQRNIEYLASYGVTEIIINVHHFADQIIDFIQQLKLPSVQLHISDERDEVLETGGGLKKASWFFDDGQAFVLMNADILTTMPLDQMLAQHRQRKALATLAVSQRESSRCFLFNEQGVLCGWRNRQTGDQKISRVEVPLHEFSFSGIHVIEPNLVKSITQEGKFSMVDAYLVLAKQYDICAFDHTGYVLLDVGKPESIEKAEKLFE